MTSVQHIPPRLAAIRTTPDSMICCFQFEQRKPLQGVTGLIDWRLLGQLSQLHISGVFTGKRSESLLVLPGKRLPTNYLVLMGSGNPESLDIDGFRELLNELIISARKLKVSHISVSLPGRNENIISGETAIAWFFQHLPSMLKSKNEFSFGIIDTSEISPIIAAESERYRLRYEMSQTADAEIDFIN